MMLIYMVYPGADNDIVFEIWGFYARDDLLVVGDIIEIWFAAWKTGWGLITTPWCVPCRLVFISPVSCFQLLFLLDANGAVYLSYHNHSAYNIVIRWPAIARVHFTLAL